MKRSRGVVKLLCAPAVAVFVLALSSVSGQTEARIVALSPPPPPHEPVGVWSGNALLMIEAHRSANPVLHVYDGSGEEMQRVAIQASGSGTLNVANNHFARSEDGFLAVTGLNYGEGAHGARFLAIIAPRGDTQRVIRPEPYQPEAVTFARDGRVWLGGWEWDGNGEDKWPTSDYFLVRILDRSGRLQRSVVPRSTFSTPYPPFAQMMLAASKDRVGFFVPSGGRYLEFDLDGKQLGEYPLAGLHDLAGVGLCEDNSAWISVRSFGESGTVKSHTLRKLDRARGAWTGDISIDYDGYLYGCRGTDLIINKDGVNGIQLRPTH